MTPLILGSISANAFAQKKSLKKTFINYLKSSLVGWIGARVGPRETLGVKELLPKKKALYSELLARL